MREFYTNSIMEMLQGMETADLDFLYKLAIKLREVGE